MKWLKSVVSHNVDLATFILIRGDFEIGSLVTILRDDAFPPLRWINLLYNGILKLTIQPDFKTILNYHRMFGFIV